MPEPQAALSFAVGDRVVYPKQGVCRVSGVEAMEIAGHRVTFITLRREEDGTVVRVNQDKVATVGLRKVAGAEEAKKLFAFLKSDSDKADLDWKQRARTNSERMSQGGIQGIAEVVKGLQVLSELRPLPAKERELYDTARHLLVVEISIALGIAEGDAEDAIDIILFPVGRERPKRTAAEFRGGAEGDEDLEVGEDLLGMDDQEEAGEEQAETEGDDGKPKKAALSDEEITQTMGLGKVPEDALPPKRKRGRPSKAAKLAEALAQSAAAATKVSPATKPAAVVQPPPEPVKEPFPAPVKSVPPKPAPAKAEPAAPTPKAAAAKPKAKPAKVAKPAETKKKAAPAAKAGTKKKKK